MLGVVRRDAAFRARFGFYPTVAVRNEEVLVVGRIMGHVVVHVEWYGDFVLHVSIACSGPRAVSIEQIIKIHVCRRDAVSPLLLRCAQNVFNRRQRHPVSVPDGVFQFTRCADDTLLLHGTPPRDEKPGSRVDVLYSLTPHCATSM